MSSMIAICNTLQYFAILIQKHDLPRLHLQQKQSLRKRRSCDLNKYLQLRQQVDPQMHSRKDLRWSGLQKSTNAEPNKFSSIQLYTFAYHAL